MKKSESELIIGNSLKIISQPSDSVLTHASHES